MSFAEVAAEVWLVLVAALTMILATASIFHALLYKRGVQATLGWVGLIALVPLVGSALYVLFGINRIARRAQRMRRVSSRLNVIPQDALTRELEILHAKHLVSKLPERWMAWRKRSPITTSSRATRSRCCEAAMRPTPPCDAPSRGPSTPS